MKPYETGICVCGKKKEEHENYYGQLFCYQPPRSALSPKFLDSGTVHLCSEEVASGMLRALQRIKELSAPESIEWSICNQAINEALKR